MVEAVATLDPQIVEKAAKVGHAIEHAFESVADAVTGRHHPDPDAPKKDAEVKPETGNGKPESGSGSPESAEAKPPAEGGGATKP